jgi:subtilisin family serine protease
MSEEYAVLWRPVSPRTTASDSITVKHFGEDAAAAEGDAARLSISTLNATEATEIAAAPDVLAIAPNMRTKLIEPRNVSDNVDSEALSALAAVGATNSKYDGAGVRVALLDTGIERNHSAFSGVDITEKDFTATGNGDRNGHGTHCAGTIFGRDFRGARIGVAPGIGTAIVGKVLDDRGAGTSLMIFDGIKWAIDQKVDVISMSLGLDFPAQVDDRVKKGWPTDLATSHALADFRRNVTMFEALMALAHAGRDFGNDPLIIAAAGNESRRTIDPSYRIAASLPAAVSDICVGATKWHGGKLVVAEFSNSNPHVVAPGVAIQSSWIGNSLQTLSGTSMACPHVAGVAALWAQSLREGGRVSGSVIRSHIVARARKDLFASGVDVVDVGQGLVTAP